MNYFLKAFSFGGSLAVAFLASGLASTPAIAQIDTQPAIVPANPQSSPQDSPQDSFMGNGLEETSETQSPVAAPSFLEDPDLVQAPLVEPGSPNANTATYTDEEISVDYPATWQIKRLEDGLMISSVTTAPTELVATQIVRMAAPPGPVINANLDSFSEEGSAVTRYSRATIDGQDAFVVWLADRPDEFGSAIATFIGYEDETILMFSRYSSENSTAEADILRLHTSFADPTDTTAAQETTAETESSTNSPVETEMQSE